MKTAFLILAHDQPAHLGRLVASLRCDWAQIFIHIDKKADITEFQRYLPQHKDVIVLDGRDRVRISWGGFNMVRATLNLLEVSLNAGTPFDRFCFLSGSDFPIKSLSEMQACFASNQEFMRIDRLVDASSSHYRNVQYLCIKDFPLPKSVISAVSRIRRKVSQKIPHYHGCSWWALTKDCVQYIVDFVQQNPDYFRFHQYTLCPDEIFFQSIVKSSPFAPQITHDVETFGDRTQFFALNEHACHYIDWNAKGVTLPKVLDQTDLPHLLSSKALFARKFRENESNGLLKLLEEGVGSRE